MPIYFRFIGLADKQRLVDFFHSHTEETIYSRYGMMVREMSPQRALELVQLDGHEQLAIVGLDGHTDAARIVAIGRYALDPATNLAEVAFVVHEQYRGVGIAKHLLRHLAQLIYIKGFSGITAQMLSSNRPMQQVLSDVLGHAEKTTSICGETTMIYRFKEGAAGFSRASAQ